MTIVATSRAAQPALIARRGFQAMAALLLFWCAPAMAHKSSDSFLHLTAHGTAVTVQWDIALRDLDAALPLDANGDGLLSWGEIRQHESQLTRYALQRLSLRNGGKPCTPGTSALLIDTHTDGAYAVLQFEANCGAPINALQVDYRLFADTDAGHRGLLNLTLADRTYTQVLGPDTPVATFGAEGSGAWRQFLGYLRTGVNHIWTGFDHLLFLFSLLLPAVLLRRGQQWEARGGLGESLGDVVRVVTAFTVAHSLTLALATFGFLKVPSRISESAIALSVVAAALNNVWPLVKDRRWVVAFCFGLIHGLGFANVLNDLGLPTSALALALVGFNLGVEAGQLAIVALFVPLFYAMRSTVFYRQYVMTAGSMGIAILASLWLTERAFNLQFLPVH
jgi:HupE / UreJ protein